MSDAPQEVDQQKAIGDDSEAKLTKSDKEKAQAVQDYSKTEENGQLSMQVKVYSPFNDYYEGGAFSLSAENATGPFDILPKHHNFISLLSACEIIVRTVNKGDQRIRISGGLMHVKSNQVIVFLDV